MKLDANMLLGLSREVLCFQIISWYTTKKVLLPHYQLHLVRFFIVVLLMTVHLRVENLWESAIDTRRKWLICFRDFIEISVMKYSGWLSRAWCTAISM